MGAIPGMLGLGGGAAGSGFGGPGGSSQGVSGVVNPTSMGQINNAYNGVQNSLQDQQALLAALQGQNGLQNQSQSYNQMQGIAQGIGPNPAQAQYQQNIQQLAKQQAGAIASQKGISPALQAQLISQQGSAAMQNAAGQGAANLATQQLGAMQAAGNIAGQQAGQQIGQTNANAQAQLMGQNQLLNAQGNANTANSGLQANINTTNAGLAGKTMDAQKDAIGGAFSGASKGLPIIGSIFGAEGGEVSSVYNPAAPSGPQSMFGKWSTGAAAIAPQQAASSAPAPATQQQPPALQKGFSDFVGGIFSNPKAYGGPANDFRSGGNVMASNPGQMAQVPGNSYSNDKIPAVLSEGEVVIPRNIMQGKNPSAGAAKFVAALMAKKGKK